MPLIKLLLIKKCIEACWISKTFDIFAGVVVVSIVFVQC